MDNTDQDVALDQEATLTGAEAILVCWKKKVSMLFLATLRAVLPIYDAAVPKHPIRHVLVRHEQAAVHAAEDMPVPGKQGCAGHVRPRATNAVTGLTDALMDPCPWFAYVQVPTHLIMNTFQEAIQQALNASHQA